MGAGHDIHGAQGVFASGQVRWHAALEVGIVRVRAAPLSHLSPEFGRDPATPIGEGSRGRAHRLACSRGSRWSRQTMGRGEAFRSAMLGIRKGGRCGGGDSVSVCHSVASGNRSGELFKGSRVCLVYVSCRYVHV